MADEELGTASVSIVLDDSATDASLDRLSDRIERALNDAARDGARRMQRQLNLAIAKINPLRVEIAADTRRFRTALNELNNLGSTEITVVPGVDPVRFRRQLQRLVRGITVRIQVEPDFTGFDQAVRAHRAPEIDVRVRPNVDGRGLQRALKGISGAVGKVGSIAGLTLAIGGLGIAAAGAATAVGALAAALAPTVGIIAAAPAAILGMVAATTALKIALSGVSDAFGAALGDDAAKFEKALKELSPAAQEAAREVRALKPEFDKLKSTVQDAFFAQLTGEITKTAEALGGVLTQGLAGIASAWGFAAKNALDFVQTAQGVADVESILSGADKAVTGLAEGSTQLTAGFLRAGAAISDAFGDRLQTAIRNNTAQFGLFLETAAGDGRLEAWVDDALSALNQLGRILGNIGGIFSGLFSAGEAAGASFLDNLEKITASFEKFVKSDIGQEALANVFKTIGAVAAQLGPIIQALITTLGGVLPALTPLLTAIGPAIQAVIKALGPAIQALLPGITTVVNAIVQALNTITSSGALNQIGAAFSAVLTAVAPIIPVIGQLAATLAGALAPVLGAIANALAPVISAIAGALAPVLPVLAKAFSTLVTALTPLVTLIGTTLAQVITAFAPLLLTVATAIGTIATALAPLIEQIAAGLAPLFAALAPAITRIVEAITPLITQLVAALLPILPPLIDAFLAILDALIPLIDPIVGLVEAIAPLVSILIEGLAPIIKFAAEILKWLTIEAVVPILSSLVEALTLIITTVSDVLTGIANFARDARKFIEDFTTAGEKAFRIMIEKVVTFFTELDDKILAALATLVVAARNKFTELKDGAVAKIRELVADAVAFFTALPGRVGSALSGLASAVGSAAGRAAGEFGRRITGLVNDAVATVKSLPGKARSALGNLGSFLYSAGQDLIRGLINGVKAMAGNIASAAKDVVAGAVKAAEDFLGISSPSKVFRQIGIFVGQGLVNGLTASEQSVKQTADKLVELIVDAFKGKRGQKTQLDDFLIRTVRSNQRELEKLVGQRQALADLIRQANEFATQTAQQALADFSLDKLFKKVTDEFDRIRDAAAKAGSGRLGSNPLIGFGRTQVEFLTDQLEASAARIRRFNKQITELARRGLRKDLIAQLIGLGPEAGADLAQQLSLASNAQIRELNAAQAQLASAAKKFGNDSADKMFDAGKQAANGFLAGLKGQKKAIEDLMISIAKGLTNAIKAALKIKSPSVVMRDIGKNTGLGLIKGINQTSQAVVKASRNLAASTLAPFTGRSVTGIGPIRGAGRPMEALANPFGSQRSALASAAVTGAAAARNRPTEDVTITNNIVINEVGNAEATAHRVINRLALAAGTI